ncbi:MAG: glycosyltransferase [Desulfovibrio sp.]|jgi:glycosyltransferase involved in cell wall biosynthesis|nr:glycosyltransferase [Desulfovibrio sp.]
MPSADFDACLLIVLPWGMKGGRGRDCADMDAPPDAEEEQALALALALHEAGRTKPYLLCAGGSWAHRRAAALKLPHLAARSRYNPLSLLKLWFWQRRHSFLLIQTVGEGSLGFGRLVRRWRKQGMSFLVHAFFVRFPSGESRKGKDLWAARKIFCGWEGIRRDLAGADPDGVQDRLVLLAPGVSRARYFPVSAREIAELGKAEENSRLPAGGRHFIFGMGCGLVARSGALAVVRAMAALWQVGDIPPWEVRITGSGPRFDEILEEAERLGVVSRLCLLGDQFAPDFLAACHVWLAPGTSPEERPDALWAGFVAGLPVICSRSPLHAERLAGHDAALMVEPDDPQALAGAMIALMSNPGLRQDLSARAAALRGEWELERMAGEARRFFSSWAASSFDPQSSTDITGCRHEVQNLQSPGRCVTEKP